MKRIVPLIVVAVLLAAGGAVKRPGWLESFDRFSDYPYSSWPSDGSKTLPAPWEGTVSMYAHAGLGCDDTPGASGPARGWSWGHAFRPTVHTPRVGDALVARVLLPGRINYESVMLALTSEKAPGAAGNFAGGAKAVLYIGGSADQGFAKLSFQTTDPSGKRLDSVPAAPHPFLPAEAWYDVRLRLCENRTVTLEYRHVKMTYWVPVGALAVHDDFRPNYVAISASRGGRMDDVGYAAARELGRLFVR